MSAILKIQQSLLTNVVEIKKVEGLTLTGEKNLTITKDELIKRITKINPAYLEVMDAEANIFVRQGLFKGYFKDDDVLGEIMFDIPDWDRFISAVDAFYKVCYAPGCENDDETLF